MRRSVLCTLALIAPVIAAAQSDISGPSQYPQFRSWSGLVGSGSGIDPFGLNTFRGAMAISTPIAYSLGKGRLVLGLGNTSYRNRLDFFQSSGGASEDSGNGSLWANGGFSTPIGNFTVGGMVLSRLGDNVLNVHFQPRLSKVLPQEDAYSTDVTRFDIGFGVQDAFSTGGTAGETLDRARGGGNSRSFYVVGTARLSENAYVSVGTGTQRFQGIFANASVNVHPRIKLIAEYDAFNWNYGVAADLGKFTLSADRDIQASIFLGQIRGKYLTWGVTLAF